MSLFNKIFKTKERPSVNEPNQKLLWYPHATMPADLKMPQKGKYPQGFPDGAIIHFTAGRFIGGVNKALDTIRGGIKNGYTFLCISNDGQLVQANPLSHWGYHCGTPDHKTKVGIEINNAGRLKKDHDKFISWFGLEIPSEDVRIVDSFANQQAGAYHKYTEAQEIELTNFLIWCKFNAPNIFKFENVLGHDEVAPKRKSDPGGSLSMSMPEYRIFLKMEFARRYPEINDKT